MLPANKRYCGTCARGSTSSSSRPASSSICSVVCSIPKRSRRVSSSRRRIRSRSQPRATTTWAASAPKPGGHGPDVEVVDRAHALLAQIAAPDPSTSRPAGAASISTSTGSLIRRQEEARIRAAISRPTIGSTTSEPPAGRRRRRRRPRASRARRRREWRSTPSRLMSSRSPRARTQVAARLPARPSDAEREHAGAVDRGRVGEAADRGDRDRDADRDQSRPLTSAASTSERW